MANSKYAVTSGAVAAELESYAKTTEGATFAGTVGSTQMFRCWSGGTSSQVFSTYTATNIQRTTTGMGGGYTYTWPDKSGEIMIGADFLSHLSVVKVSYTYSISISDDRLAGDSFPTKYPISQGYIGVVGAETSYYDTMVTAVLTTDGSLKFKIFNKTGSTKTFTVYVSLLKFTA